GEDYSDFLENNLPELLEDIDLNLRRQIWFQHDGVPPQNSRLTQKVLNTWYPHRLHLPWASGHFGRKRKLIVIKYDGF
ncbi:unnamed protein product, partial [Tenebrio molitor]